MPEPTLALSYADFQVEVAMFLGYGRGASQGDTAWTALQQAQISSDTRSGLRAFYWPQPLGGEATAYDWSFLHPVASLSLASAAQSLVLPEDYGGAEGQLTVAGSGSTAQPFRIEWRNEAKLREAYSVTPDATGPPMLAAVRPLKNPRQDHSPGSELFVFPAADQAYTLQLSYVVNPNALTASRPYPYGGAQHAETILESCLAVAENRRDDNRGIHAARFLERLAASIALDRRHKPQNLGPNLDRSDDRRARWGGRHWWNWPATTYNGASMD